ncbi:MAG: DUF4190 domain-containing protein [Candidatus Sumerlaeota bacterium]|nr:DUF4190 domain-containing protein [Candidatus Sumerlaeota bacterium]
MAVCPRCNSPISESGGFCSRCGAPISGVYQPSPMQAPMQAARTSALAIIALIGGILSMACLGVLTGIPTAIIGVIALVKINRSGGRLTGSAFAIVGLVLGCVGFFTGLILTAIAIPNFLEAQTRAKVSRSKADMRSMATGLEAYYVDNGAYCAWSADPSLNVFSNTATMQPELPPEMKRQPTFMQYNPSDKMFTLTTPVAYVRSYFSDPFAPAKGATYCYYSCGSGDNAGWIIWSAGPDMKYDMTADNISQIYNPKNPQFFNELLKLAFDPTNGAISGGDVFRIKQ